MDHARRDDPVPRALRHVARELAGVERGAELDVVEQEADLAVRASADRPSRQVDQRGPLPALAQDEAAPAVQVGAVLGHAVRLGVPGEDDAVPAVKVGAQVVFDHREVRADPPLAPAERRDDHDSRPDSPARQLVFGEHKVGRAHHGGRVSAEPLSPNAVGSLWRRDREPGGGSDEAGEHHQRDQ